MIVQFAPEKLVVKSRRTPEKGRNLRGTTFLHFDTPRGPATLKVVGCLVVRSADKTLSCLPPRSPGVGPLVFWSDLISDMVCERIAPSKWNRYIGATIAWAPKDPDDISFVPEDCISGEVV